MILVLGSCGPAPPSDVLPVEVAGCSQMEPGPTCVLTKPGPITVCVGGPAAPTLEVDGFPVDAGWAARQGGFTAQIDAVEPMAVLRFSDANGQEDLRVVRREDLAALAEVRSDPSTHDRLHALHGRSDGEELALDWACAAAGDPDLDFSAVETTAATLPGLWA